MAAVTSALNSEGVRAIRSRLLRKKPMNDVAEEAPLNASTKFNKCLTTLDLVSLGVGSCVGTGMYVVAGMVARQMAGPGVIFSFLIAAVASLLSGICYAEFGVRAPKTTGSAYMYSYVTVGEFFAFIIGWNLILEYMIGTAAGASALSSCFDSLSHHAISSFMHSIGAGTQEGRGFPDVVAFIIVIAMTILLAAGVKSSVWFNNALNLVNFAAWVFVVICGLFYVEPEIWKTEGVLPYGASGVFAGAATCFYAFIGFDIIATTGEESRNPSRSIPLAIVLTLVICFVAYESCSLIVTLMVPYDQIDPESALTTSFVYRGANAAKYFVAFGAISSLTASLLGSQFPMARIIYAMSHDGLLFSYFDNVSAWTNTPIIATLVSGLCAALLALLLPLQALVEMMSIGTLLAYSLVSISVLLLRYEPSSPFSPAPQIEDQQNGKLPSQGYGSTTTQNGQPGTNQQSYGPAGGYHDSSGGLGGSRENLVGSGDYESGPGNFDEGDIGLLPRPLAMCYDSLVALIEPKWRVARVFIGLPDDTVVPTKESSSRVATLMLLISIDFLFLHLVTVFSPSWTWYFSISALVFLAIGIFLLYLIMREPQNKTKLRFMTPWVPFLPVMAVFANIYLMLKLSPLTWLRFVIWMAIGFAIYFGYGIWSSAQAPSSDKQKGGELLNKLSAGPQSGPGGASSGYDALQSMENNQPVNQGGGTDYSMGGGYQPSVGGNQQQYMMNQQSGAGNVGYNQQGYYPSSQGGNFPQQYNNTPQRGGPNNYQQMY